MTLYEMQTELAIAQTLLRVSQRFKEIREVKLANEYLETARKIIYRVQNELRKL